MWWKEVVSNKLGLLGRTRLLRPRVPRCHGVVCGVPQSLRHRSTPSSSKPIGADVLAQKLSPAEKRAKNRGTLFGKPETSSDSKSTKQPPIGGTSKKRKVTLSKDESRFPANTKGPRLHLSEKVSKSELVYDVRYGEQMSLLSAENLRQMEDGSKATGKGKSRESESAPTKDVLFSFSGKVGDSVRSSRWVQLALLSTLGVLTPVSLVLRYRDYTWIDGSLLQQDGGRFAWELMTWTGSVSAVFAISLLFIARRLWKEQQRATVYPLVDCISVVQSADLMLAAANGAANAGAAPHLDSSVDKLLRLDIREKTWSKHATVAKFIPLQSGQPLANRFMELIPHVNDESQLPDSKCVIKLYGAQKPDDVCAETGSERQSADGSAEDSYKDLKRQRDSGVEMTVELPKDGSVHNWEALMTLMQPLPNASGKFHPVKVRRGYVPVATLSELLSADRSTLEVFTHGVPPYRRKYSFLFVPNALRTALYVTFDHCRAVNAPLVHGGVYYEKDEESFLHCANCVSARTGAVAPLKSSVDWLLESDFEEENGESQLFGKNRGAMNDGRGLDTGYCKERGVFEALRRDETVYVKLELGDIAHHRPAVDAYGTCTLEHFLHFHCTNCFRQSMPERPQSVDHLWVLGNFTKFDSWKHSVRSLKVASKND